MRFIDEKQLSIVTVGGHGYGAKVACAFGSFNMERTSGVICMEGGPYDHSYHEAWEEIKTAIISLSKIDMSSASQNDVYRSIDAAVDVIMIKYRILNGELSLNKMLLQVKVTSIGNLIWKDLLLMLKKTIDVILQDGLKDSVYIQEEHLLCLPNIHIGYS